MAQEILILGQPSQTRYDVAYFHEVTPVVYDGLVRLRIPQSEMPDLLVEILDQAQLDAINAGEVIWDIMSVETRSGTGQDNVVRILKQRWDRWSVDAEQQWAHQWARTGTWINR